MPETPTRETAARIKQNNPDALFPVSRHRLLYVITVVSVGDRLCGWQETD